MIEDLEIDGLIDEHRALMTIMATLRRAADQPDAEVDGLLGELTAALAHHTEREEAGLFHTLREVKVPPEEHGSVFSNTITDTSSSSSSRSGVTGTGVDDLLKSLEAHMVREETDMFPAAEQLLGPADWDAVDAAVAHLR